jgi:hypothetical protein
MLPWDSPLSNHDILHYAKKLGISKFRGVYCRNSLPRKPWSYECGILNLDTVEGGGTHWTAYIKDHEDAYYYDSFGNLSPPKELISYLHSSSVYYNRQQDQQFGTVICGQLCLQFLYLNTSKHNN